MNSGILVEPESLTARKGHLKLAYVHIACCGKPIDITVLSQSWQSIELCFHCASVEANADKAK